ncbi:hypothetical protein SHJG_0984 [Streptomyces hygroscopicus subsp. jinggangensis 5008]|nr:hypothetical protein SHJG_0984 [Streptomyces hygroscopicus subsp. jinggangensis 5008]AGF60483.1 hypothetical protein SHJGH_0817 [Streptomyces hygroscopicus subsp. jinggangensis TL01]
MCVFRTGGSPISSQSHPVRAPVGVARETRRSGRVGTA